MSATREKWIHHRKEQTRSLIPTCTPLFLIGTGADMMWILLAFIVCDLEEPKMLDVALLHVESTVIDGDQGELSKD
ncbi:hypothetical protein Tco_0396467 [Tanacetum coccineum]